MTPSLSKDNLRNDAISLGQRWAVEAELTGKPMLARYYLRKVVALQASTLPHPIRVPPVVSTPHIGGV